MVQRQPLVVVTAAVTAVVFVLVLAVRAQTDGSEPNGSDEAPGTPDPSARNPADEPADELADEPSGQATPPLEGFPFTGRTGAADEPVLAVKIDNAAPARPPTGLADADLVYVEPVEAGLSRLLAVYSSRLPETVGPIRSARETDLELLRQFGEPAFAFSGAHNRLLPRISDAPSHDVSPKAAGGAYLRSAERPAPHDLYADPEGLLAHAPRASQARDIGFRFGAAPDGGQPRAEHTIGYPAAEIEFAWSDSDEAWRVFADSEPLRDADGADPLPSTVAVQQTTIRDSELTDSSGNASPYVATVGSGPAVVLRDGRVHEARWSRESRAGGTTFTTLDGEPMTFAPGQVWVVFDEG